MTSATIAKALLYKVVDGQEPNESDESVIKVQFNPASLSYSVQNTLEKKGKDAKAKQFVAQSTAKLEFDLQFDATHDGLDVRSQTDRVKKLLDPGSKEECKDQAPPVVGFRWGTFKFKGIIESFKETLDFFSHDGLPLRSLIKLSLSAQDPKDIFTDESFDQTTQGGTGSDVRLASVPPGGMQQLAENGGNPAAARGLGAANGVESLRNPGSAVAAVGGGVELKAAAGFSAGASASFGLSVGVSGGLGIGAGVSAGSSGAAFSGLRVGVTPKASAALDLSRLKAPAVCGPSASFGLGGKAQSGASVGLSTDVGASARIRFD